MLPGAWTAIAQMGGLIVLFAFIGALGAIAISKSDDVVRTSAF